MRRRLIALLTVLGCAAPPPAAGPGPMPAPAPPAPATRVTAHPFLPPAVARLAGLMPLRSLGIEQFRQAQPDADGRGVLIAILDGGLDAGVPGLRATSTGQPKLVDLRDFSGEGRIALAPVTPAGDSLVVEGQVVHGVGRLGRRARPPYWAGTLRELTLGQAPAADVNGDGDADDAFPLVVARGTDGWILMTDTDADGSLDDERELRDFAVAGDTFSYGPLTLAVNLAGPAGGEPVLDLFFDTSGHGTHVAGIAAGQGLFAVAGFDGAAPGAQLLGLKIANNARGGISVNGSMMRAMHYAADVAARRGQPLVLNLSYGVGNEGEGSAVIDSLVDAFALAHPDVLIVISAGNDGPGISTIGFPGSAEFALSVCALFPGVFADPPRPGARPREDVMGWWSSRGGEVQKPDVCAPGVAFSNVPPWQTGEEVSGGTSMAAPQLSGAAALLQSALLARGARPARAVDLRRALMATAQPIAGASLLDAGTGVPDVGEAFRWLLAAHQPGVYQVRALADGGNQSRATAAYRRHALAPGDTLQRFAVTSLAGQPAATVQLAADAPWLSAPARVAFRGAPVTIPVTYQAELLERPGLYVGTVWARSASDPLGGALFGLTSTVIVPHDLTDGPVHQRTAIPAGQERRTFVHVPEGAAGLHVTAHLELGAEATLTLFEPSGRPHRDGGELELGSDGARRGGITVRAEDAVPGVWEIVAVAPPLAPATVGITAGIPAVRLWSDDGAITLENPTAGPLTVHLTARSLGSEVRWEAVGAGAPVRRTFVLPDWATAVGLEVLLDPAVWGWFTDFGASLLDDEGRVVAAEPLNYATGRQVVPLEADAGRSVGVELFPAYAREDMAPAWTADVRVGFRREPQPAPVLGGRADTTLVLPAGASRRLAPSPADLPAGTRVLLEVTADAGGVPAVRRAAIVPPRPVPVEAGQ